VAENDPATEAVAQAFAHLCRAEAELSGARFRVHADDERLTLMRIDALLKVMTTLKADIGGLYRVMQ
jgi:hypothetical protein